MELAILVYLVEILTTTGAGPFFLGLGSLIAYVALRIYRRDQVSEVRKNRVIQSDCRFGKEGDTIVIKRRDSDGEVWAENVTSGTKFNEYHIDTAIYAISSLESVGEPQVETKTSNWWIVFTLLIWSYGVLMPDRDVAVKMVAAYAVQEVATNDNVQQFAGNSLLVVEKLMSDYLAESEEEATEEAPSASEESTEVEGKTSEKASEEVSETKVEIPEINTEAISQNVQEVGKLAGDMVDTYKAIEEKLSN